MVGAVMCHPDPSWGMKGSCPQQLGLLPKHCPYYQPSSGIILAEENHLAQGHTSFQRQPTPKNRLTGGDKGPDPHSNSKGHLSSRISHGVSWGLQWPQHSTSQHSLMSLSSQSASFSSFLQEFIPKVLPYKLPSCQPLPQSLLSKRPILVC